MFMLYLINPCSASPPDKHQRRKGLKQKTSVAIENSTISVP